MEMFLLERRNIANSDVDRTVKVDWVVGYLEGCCFAISDGYGARRDSSRSDDSFILVGELGGGDCVGARGNWNYEVVPGFTAFEMTGNPWVKVSTWSQPLTVQAGL